MLFDDKGRNECIDLFKLFICKKSISLPAKVVISSLFISDMCAVILLFVNTLPCISTAIAYMWGFFKIWTVFSDIIRTVICSADNKEIGFMYKLYSARAMHVRFMDITYLIGRLFMCNPMEDHSAELSDIENDVLKIGNIVAEDERRSFKMALYSRVNQIVIKEILDLADRSPDILRNLFVAMFGDKDMYVIEPKRERRVRIQAFNLNGSLSCNYTPYPAKIEDIRQSMDYPNMFSVLMEGGWNLTFRLHTASSRVKSFQNFKYDIQLKHGANDMTDLLIKY